MGLQQRARCSEGHHPRNQAPIGVEVNAHPRPLLESCGLDACPNRVWRSDMSARLKLTPEVREKFLEALEASLTVTKACEALGIGRRTVYDARKNDPEFAAAWDAAYERGTAALEDEAVRRAHD